MNNPRTRRRAFTLIELAGVLVVVSFLAGFDLCGL